MRKIFECKLSVVILMGIFFTLLTTSVFAGSNKIPTWTIMVYMAGDNDLDYYSELDIEEMKKVGSTSNVNIVVLWDRWKELAYLYKVLKHGLELTDSNLNGKELNMGDAKTLEEFVEYSIKKFKADHYVLIPWDHGDDFRGFAWDYHTGIQGEEVDFLTHQEIIQGLKGFPLDILAFDGCVMALIDVPYEYFSKGLDIDYMVGSEGYIPLQGLPYDTILSNLIGNPSIAPRDFSTLIIKEYVEFYNSQRWQTTLSAIEISKMGDLMDKTSVLIDLLMKDMETYHGIITKARGQSNLGWSEYGWEALVDFMSFVNLIGENAPDKKISDLSNSILKILSSAVYVGNTPTMEKRAGGLSVFFPPSYESFLNNRWWYGNLYENMRFASEVWLDFLYSYWNLR